MENLRLCDSDYRFMMIVWEVAPINSGKLVQLCSERLGWKKSTTYTQIKKMCEKGYIENKQATVSVRIPREKVQADEIFGHGGLFKTKGVGQGILAAAMNAPVSVMETAGEGGAWGIAVLAAYMQNRADGEALSHYLNETVFAGNKGSKMEPDAEDVAGFDAFIRQYTAGYPMEKAAVESMGHK